MTNPVPITLAQLFRYVRKNPDGSYALPHQAAGIAEMELDIQQNGYPAAMRRDRPWFATWSQAGKQPDPARILEVPYLAQLDSATDQGRRMCFSSSCAMLLQYLKPSLSGLNGDDQYLKRVQEFGDTTDAAAQIKALASYGIKARFVQNAGWRTIEDQIAQGVPVPCGFLHRGPVTAPAGGGHWLIVVGHTADQLIVHDPFGESDLVTGATVSSVARFAGYSRTNFGPRWMVEGPGTGWAIIAERR